MKRIVASVGAVLMLVFVAACSPAADAPTQPEWQPESFTAQVNELNVVYHVVEDFPAHVPEDDWFYLDSEGVCNVYATQEFLTVSDGPTFQMLAGAVAACHYDGNDYEVERSRFINGWIALYNLECDRKLEPLGWGYASDGACNVPTFESVLTKM